jgi:hypothetical protein
MKRRRKLWAAVLAGVAAAVAIVGLRIYTSVVGTCSDRERSVLLEFPQYGGARLEPQNDSYWGGCAVSLDTSGVRDEVLGYYRRQLQVHGWTVRDFEEQTPGTGGEPAGSGNAAPSAVIPSQACAPDPAPCAGTLAETRARFSYSVAFESTGQSTSLIVRVAEQGA